jgi:hypothetical protein
VSTVELTAIQRNVLLILDQHPLEAWLADRPIGKYALVIETILGDFISKANVASPTLTALHQWGFIDYGPDRELVYLDGESLTETHKTNHAMQVQLTRAGRHALHDQKARHRASS